MNKDDVFNFIVKISKDETIMCDYFEIKDNFKMLDEYLSAILIELKDEKKIIAKNGEYLPKRQNMTKPKKEVESYANGEFINFFEDHINYFKSLVYKLEMMATVYNELKVESAMNDGWIPTPEFTKHLNRAKMELDIVYFEILRHQKEILTGKRILEDVNKLRKELKENTKEEKKEGDIFSSIYQ